jgi:hypothetical protein
MIVKENNLLRIPCSADKLAMSKQLKGQQILRKKISPRNGKFTIISSIQILKSIANESNKNTSFIML